MKALSKNWLLLYLAAIICFCVFGVMQLKADGSIVERNDSEGYLGISEFSLSEILSGREYCFDDYYCQNRPVLIPLIYKLCQQNIELIVWVQLIFSLLSWIFFASCAATLLDQSITNLMLFCALLGLGSIPNVTRWNNIIMSESITISLTMLFLGFLLLFCNRKRNCWSWRYLVPFLLVCGLLLLARDPSSWTVAFGALLLVIAGWRVCKRKALISAGIMILMCALVLSTTGDRWKFSYFNVLFVRILNDPQSEAYFMDRGIPRPQEVDQLKGYKHTQTFPVFNSEPLIPLRQWVMENGLRVYAGWLFYRATDTLRAPWYDHFEREAYETVDSIYKNDDYQSLIPDTLSKFFSLNIPGIFYALLGLIALYLLIIKNEKRLLIPAAFVLSAYFFCTLIYSLDAYDFARQSAETFISMRACAWIIMFILTEQALSSGRDHCA